MAGKNEDAYRMRDSYAVIKSLLIVMKQDEFKEPPYTRSSHVCISSDC